MVGWSAILPMCGCWSAGCWLPVCHLFNLRGLQGAYSHSSKLLAWLVLHICFDLFFLTPFLEPKSPTCVKLVPKSDPKVIQNLAFCRHGEPHSDMVFTDREPHWPIQGRFQKPAKKQVFKKHPDNWQNDRTCAKKWLPGVPRGWPTKQHFPLIFRPGAPGWHFGARVEPKLPKCTKMVPKSDPQKIRLRYFASVLGCFCDDFWSTHTNTQTHGSHW